MKNYESYTVEDFVDDPYFQAWLKKPDNPEIAGFWEDFLTRHPEQKENIEKAAQILYAFSLNNDIISRQEQEALLANIKARISEAHRSGEVPVIERFRKSTYGNLRTLGYAWYKVAAVFVGIVLFAAAYLLIAPFDDTTLYSTSYGETKTITLPDNSEITLNGNSSIEYDEELFEAFESGEDRKVTLEGEAFFNIRKAGGTEFIVHTDQLDVQVMGTQFNVNHRRDKTQVVLNKGKIKLKSRLANELIMEPGELVELANNERQYKQKQVDPEVYASWRKNKLVFEGTSLATIARMLEDNYGYQVSFANDSLAQLQFTGSNPANDIDLLIKTLSRSFDIQLVRKDKKIIIKNSGD